MAHHDTTAMESIQAPVSGPARFERIYVWQLPIRLFHWLNGLCVTVLFLSGSSGEAWNKFFMGWVREIHFSFAFVFVVNYAWRGAWFFLGNHYARTGFPSIWSRTWWRSLLHQLSLYLRLEAGKPHLGHNPMAGVAYTTFVIGLGTAQIFTGFALYSQSNPGGFIDGLVGWVIPLLGGPFQTLMWHHLTAWGFVVFVILHLYIILLDSREFRNGLIGSMIHGNKFRRVSEEPDDD
ncbi:MAG: Ni/Fe-hydrogenase, b-type cytochrome subunit [Deltaproteobacteria bacterium]|nr:Ni/Fe-hydrogenase, b-type cytochrome subunit [Deltaproteobacteria bacterium]